MLELALFSVALTILFISAYTDIRTREVPDWVNFFGIIAGFGIRLLWGVSTNDWSILGWGVLGFAAFFALAVLMYYTGQWGGGDSKLLMAMGALLGLQFTRDSIGIAFILWSLAAGAAYGLIWSLFLAISQGKQFMLKYKTLSRSIRWAHLPVLGVFVFGVAFAVASNDQWFRVLALCIAFIAPVLFYVGLGVKAVEQCCMYKITPPARLTEGDWIAKNVTHKGKYLCGPKDLGITKKQIQLLQKLKIKNVLVKEGIPFTPTFLIGFLLALWLGSPLKWFI